MSWDSVPWFIGGGAQHSPEVARLLAFAATSGAEGIVAVGDLKVSALSVPGGSVHVADGAALVLNRAAGGTSQTYVARLPSEDTATIAPTGGSARSDLIVAQIEDPFMAGEPWQDPVDPTVGPYVFTRVISNVPAGTTSLQAVSGYSGRSALVLARIDIPANTGTITAAMITDLRKLAQPREHREVFMGGVSAASTITASSSAITDWPVYTVQVYVPTWATRVDLMTTVTSFQVSAVKTDGNVRAVIGTIVGGAQALDLDNPSGPTREAVTLLAGATVPVAMRGTLATIKVQTDMVRGTLVGRKGTQVVHDVNFYEKAV